MKRRREKGRRKAVVYKNLKQTSAKCDVVLCVFKALCDVALCVVYIYLYIYSKTK